MEMDLARLLLFVEWILIFVIALSVTVVLSTGLRYRRGRRVYAISPYLLIYLLAMIASLFGILIVIIEIFFSEAYVTYDVFLGGGGVLLMCIVMLFLHLNSRIDGLYLSRRRR